METTLSPKVNRAYRLLTGLVQKKAPGEKLPPVQDLMKQLSMSQLTIQRACNLLEAQGIIERKRREGIFVTNRLSTGEFAIIVKPQLLNPEATPYYPLAIRLLSETIHRQHHNYEVKLHLGKQTPIGREFPSTLDINRTEALSGIRGVFSFAPLYELEEKLQKAGIPLVMLGLKETPQFSVSFETKKTFLQNAVQYLSEIGCRSVGLLWFSYSYRNLTKSEDYGSLIVELCKNSNLQCLPEWINPIVLSESQSIDAQQQGAEFISNLWQMQQRPEALIVTDEIYCRGILSGIASLGISMPRDIKLVTQATRGVRLPYHLPVTRVEYDVEDQMQKAVHMMIGLVNGHPPISKHISIPGTFIRGTTT